MALRKRSGSPPNRELLLVFVPLTSQDSSGYYRPKAQRYEYINHAIIPRKRNAVQSWLKVDIFSRLFLQSDVAENPNVHENAVPLQDGYL
jgi:hypothetical protein